MKHEPLLSDRKTPRDDDVTNFSRGGHGIFGEPEVSLSNLYFFE